MPERPPQDQISSQKTPHFRSGDEPYEPKGVAFVLERNSHKQIADPAEAKASQKHWNPELEMIARQPRTDNRVVAPFEDHQAIDHSLSQREPEEFIADQKQLKPKISSTLNSYVTQTAKPDGQIDLRRRQVVDERTRGQTGMPPRRDAPVLVNRQLEDFPAPNSGYARYDGEDPREHGNFEPQTEPLPAKHNYYADHSMTNQSHDYRSTQHRKGASNWIDESLYHMHQQMQSVRILEDEVRKTGPAADSRVNNIIEKLLQSPLDATGESLSRTPTKKDYYSQTGPDYSLSGHKTPTQRRVTPIPYNQVREADHPTPEKSDISASNMKPAREGGVLSLLSRAGDHSPRYNAGDNFMHEDEHPKMAKWAGWDDRRLPPRPSDEIFQPTSTRFDPDSFQRNQANLITPPSTWNYSKKPTGYETLPEKYLARASQSTLKPKHSTWRSPTAPFHIETNIQQANILKHKEQSTLGQSTNSRRITALGHVLTSDLSRSPPRPYTQYASGSSTHRDYKNPYSRHMS